MAMLTVTSNGQVTIPKDLLAHLGVGPGENLVIDKLPDGRIEIRAAKLTGHISEVFGSLKQEGGPRLSIDEINELVAQGWAGER